MKYRYFENAFYPWSRIEDYKSKNVWPENGIDVDEAVFMEYSGAAPKGKVRAPDSNKMPSWIDIQPATKDELIAGANIDKQKRLNEANYYINSKQWPGKAALGRLKNVDFTQYNLWLDYIELLEGIDITNGPEFNWPVPPTVTL